MAEQAERIEYRVVHGMKTAIALTVAMDCDRSEAERIRDTYNPVGFNDVFHNIRLQERPVNSWKDCATPEDTETSAPVAQLGGHRICTPEIAGSRPAGGFDLDTATGQGRC